MELLFTVSIICSFLYYLIKGNTSLHMLQQNWYNEGNRYISWLISNIYKVFIMPDMFFFIFLTGLFIPSKWLMVLFVVFYSVCALDQISKNKKIQIKKPLVFTKRVKRLIMTKILLFIVMIIVMNKIVTEENLYMLYIIIGLFIYLDSIISLLAVIINKPVEKQVYNYYMRKAKRKLKSMNNLDVIGITGSYGKTSSKNILNDILSVKFSTCPSPKNFNTPNGLMITINNHLDKFSNILIAEMGAFKKGEIKELCDFVHPKYGILTKIGTAHMDSFGSQENIQNGKFELIESLPKDGCGILNGDDKLQLNYKLKNKCNILWIGIENKDVDVRATNIKMTYKGTNFDVVFKGDTNKYNFETKLLGEANIYNILASIALGKYLGLSIEQLKIGVKKVKTIEHRLELKKYGDINIIDDAYNSNPVGSKMAVEVLGMMPGTKIIVTPGMIELGEEEYELNMKFGQYIAKVCDEVILVGKEQTKAIYEGLLSKNYDENKIHVINDVKLAFGLMQKLKKGDTYVLLENDLPDIFNEK